MNKKAHILVGDPDPDAALAKVEALEAHGYRGLPASDPKALLALAEKRRPEVVLIGGFEDGANALDIAGALKAADSTATIPVILTAGADMTTRRKALEIGVDDILSPDAGIAETVARLPRLVRASVMQGELERRVASAAAFGVDVDPRRFARNYPERPRVLVVCEDGSLLSDLQQALLMDGFHAIPERSSFRAGERIDDERLDAAVIALADPSAHEAATALCAHIRANPRLFNLPTLILMPEAPSDAVRDALYRGGASIVMVSGGPITSGTDAASTLAVYLHMLVVRQRRRWTLRDPFKATLVPATADETLDNIYGRAFLDHHLTRVLETAEARDADLAVCVVSIDNLPDVTGEYGDEAGHVLLHQMAAWVGGMARIEDLAARFGPHAFALVFPDTPESEAVRVAHRIGGILHQSEFHLTEEVMAVIRVWPTVGVAARQAGDTPETLLARADAARM